MLKGNKGEWTELYVLTSLLSEGKLYQSDINLEKDYNNVYDIIKAYKNETAYTIEFVRDNEIRVFQTLHDFRNEIANIPINEMGEISKALFKGIIKGKGKSFKIEDVNDFINKLSIEKLKAKSSEKADIKLRIYDHRLAKETDLGFSIKSLLGGSSTLFNTGAGNNFIYKVDNVDDIIIDDFNKITLTPEENISKISCRIRELEKKGAFFTFKSIQSNNLFKNLKMIDGDLPEILSWALYYRYLYRKSSLLDVVELLEHNDPMNFYGGEISLQKLYEYKIKKFLSEVAMGMTSEKPWMGEYDSFGGVIIAKSDGDIVCFHIYDFNLFRDYLLNNTVFEQAATGEDKENPGYPNHKSGKNYYFGWLYSENSDLFLKLNLQVRFKN